MLEECRWAGLLIAKLQLFMPVHAPPVTRSTLESNLTFRNVLTSEMYRYNGNGFETAQAERGRCTRDRFSSGKKNTVLV
jgi:hypothetical protein